MFYDIFDEFFGGLDKDFNLFYGAPKNTYKDAVCPNCHMHLNEVVQKGRAGCSECYTVFRSQFEAMLSRIHANTQHTGKIPASAGKRLQAKKELENLKQKLKTSIETQDFEQAAVLRDEIKTIEEKEGI